jgi:hypothetical protein
MEQLRKKVLDLELILKNSHGNYIIILITIL